MRQKHKKKIRTTLSTSA